MRYVSPGGDDTSSACLDAAAPCQTIAGALAAADPGDTLSLSTGTFYEAGLEIEKDVVIQGAGRSATIIDGDGRSGSRVHFFQHARADIRDAVESSKVSAAKGSGTSAGANDIREIYSTHHRAWYGESTLEGSIFTVTGGVTAEMQGITFRDGGRLFRHASGAIVNNGTLTIVDATLEHNVAFHGEFDDSDDYGKGGAIRNSGSLTIEQSVIRHNFAVGATTAGGRGGGIFNEGILRLVESTVAENEAWDVQDFCEGGGIWNSGRAVIKSSAIVRNGSDCFEGGAGGGVYNAGSLVIEGAIVGGNSARSTWEYGAGFGGGIANTDSLVLVNTTISRNVSGKGAGIYSKGSVHIAGATIAENEAVDREYAKGLGGGLHASGEVTVWNSIIMANTAGGLRNSPSADCEIDAPPTSGFILSAAETGCPATALSIQPDAPLTDLFKEPMDAFVYVPKAGSMAIDAGECSHPDGGFLTVDQRGKGRPFDDPDVENASDGCDVGAIELQQSVDNRSSGGAVASDEGAIPYELRLEQNFPNPFNGSTHIEFSIPRTARAILTVYDLRGSVIARLVDTTLPQGKHEVQWNADNLSSGIYVYRLSVGDYTESRRMTHVR